MKLPKRLRVGWRWYRVGRFPQDRSQSESTFGLCDRMKGRILVSTHFGPEKTAHTILHECLHAMWIDRGLPFSATEEELVVSELTNALCSFVRDNPDECQTWLDIFKA